MLRPPPVHQAAFNSAGPLFTEPHISARRGLLGSGEPWPCLRAASHGGGRPPESEVGCQGPGPLRGLMSGVYPRERNESGCLLLTRLCRGWPGAGRRRHPEQAGICLPKVRMSLRPRIPFRGSWRRAASSASLLRINTDDRRCCAAGRHVHSPPPRPEFTVCTRELGFVWGRCCAAPALNPDVPPMPRP